MFFYFGNEFQWICRVYYVADFRARLIAFSFNTSNTSCIWNNCHCFAYKWKQRIENISCIYKWWILLAANITGICFHIDIDRPKWERITYEFSILKYDILCSLKVLKKASNLDKLFITMEREENPVYFIHIFALCWFVQWKAFPFTLSYSSFFYVAYPLGVDFLSMSPLFFHSSHFA